jgi:dTDP-4-dehydrorhamnose reductase
MNDLVGQRPVWITGAHGLIGGYLASTSPENSSWICRPLTRQDLDLTNSMALRALFLKESPALVIHCAALSRTQDCENDPSSAHKLNVEVTRCLAELCSTIPLVFLSSDLVFDGSKGHYREADEPNPLSVYARTKVEAETAVLRNPRHLVIRTSLNGGISRTADRGFNEQMKRAWIRGETLKLFTDEFRSPIPAEFTARAIWELARQNVSGIFHVAGSERLSRWEIGSLLAARLPTLEPRIKALRVADVPELNRPPDTSLNCDKAQKLLSFQLPAFGSWLKENPTADF